MNYQQIVSITIFLSMMGGVFLTGFALGNLRSIGNTYDEYELVQQIKEDANHVNGVYISGKTIMYTIDSTNGWQQTREHEICHALVDEDYTHYCEE